MRDLEKYNVIKTYKKRINHVINKLCLPLNSLQKMEKDISRVITDEKKSCCK